jgi:hypothetical protein
MKRSKFIDDVRHHIADTGEAEAIATLAEGAGVQWDPEEEEPELRFCPNPECVSPGALRVQWSNVSGRVVCDGCSIEGPAGARYDAGKEDAEAEAVRLWNLLPRTQDEVPAKRPEEPELPERVHLVEQVRSATVAVLDETNQLLWRVEAPGERGRATLRDLAARYNQDEREKLR